MESTEQWQHEAGAGSFAGMATALQDHGDRLAQLAEACRAEARELADREARIDEREQAIAEGFAELDRRRGELENWKRELEEAATRAREAEARIAEAAEREAALRTVAQAVLARFPAE
jgi:DNA repair exonuclease SbcCD ATPase subunit